MTQLADWQVALLTTIPFTQWWSEWQEHLFRGSLKVYCIALNEDYQGADDEVHTKFLSLHFSFHTASSYSDKYLQQVDYTSRPTISRSGQPIRYSPPTNYPLIGYDGPTLADVAAGKKTQDDQHQEDSSKDPRFF